MSLIDNLSAINTIKQNIKNAIEFKGQNVTNFASYPNAIENISSGGEGVYQYNSLENMYADISNRSNGDLAAVYYSSQSSVQPGDILNDVTFPKQVTFDIAITSSASLMISGAEMYCQCRLSPTQFYIQDWSGTIPYIIYTSSDGLAYTRTDTYEDTYNFDGVTMPTNANTNICKFFIVGSTVFNGLFQYNGTNFDVLPNTGLTANIEDVYKSRFYGQNGIQNGIFNKTTSLNLAELRNRVNLYSNISSLKLNNTVTNIMYLFGGSNIKYVPNFDTSNVSQMCSVFSGCSNLVSVPNFNTINVINMYDTFYNCRNLTSISNFNTTNVTSMWGMLYNCQNLTSVPNFDTSNVINMSNMLSSCYNLKNVPNFDTSNVVSMSYMFAYCNNLVNAPVLNTSKVVDMYRMFTNCLNLISVPEFNTNNVTDMCEMFSYCSNLSADSYANISNSLPLAKNLSNYYLLNIGLSIENFTSEQKKILGGKEYVEMLPYVINSSNVSSYWNIRINNSTWTNVSKGNYDVVGQNLKNNIPKAAVNIIVTDTGDEGTLYYATKLFYSFTNLKSINLSNLKTDKLKRCEYMFGSCYKLTSVPNFNTSNVINISGMFYNCQNLTSVPNFDTVNVTNISFTFYDCYRLTSIPNWNTSNVVSMYHTFNSCSNLISVPDFDTSNVTNMSNMFYNCQNLTSVPNFDTSNVRYMESMFYGCGQLTTIPNWNVSKVIDMKYMFIGCKNLTTVPNFDTSNVVSMSYMFDEVINLVNVPQLNTSNVTNLSSMFSYCNNLSNASIQNIINMCLNSNITNKAQMNLNNENDNSPLSRTKFDNSYYQNRWAELTAAGWTY